MKYIIGLLFLTLSVPVFATTVGQTEVDSAKDGFNYYINKYVYDIYTKSGKPGWTGGNIRPPVISATYDPKSGGPDYDNQPTVTYTFTDGNTYKLDLFGYGAVMCTGAGYVANITKDYSYSDQACIVTRSIAPAPTSTPTYTFIAAPAVIKPGQSSTLQWNISNAQSVTIDGQGVANQGSKIVSPSQTTSYLLHAVLTNGSTKDLNTSVIVSSVGASQWKQRESQYRRNWQRWGYR